jgi:hypothetical protein
LDLVVRVHGGTRQDALKWIAELSGVSLQQTTAQDLSLMQQTRSAMERDMPDATLWRHAAVEMGEELLSALKEGLYNPAAKMQPEEGEIAALTSRVAVWKKLSGESLVEEFRRQQDKHPEMTAQMVEAARTEEREIQRLLPGYLQARETLSKPDGAQIGTSHKGARDGMRDGIGEELLIARETARKVHQVGLRHAVSRGR